MFRCYLKYNLELTKIIEGFFFFPTQTFVLDYLDLITKLAW